MIDISETKPLISVIMPVYNIEMYLAEAIDSILAQTFTDWELICIDDGSSDNSLSILRGYERADPRVRVLTRAHAGVARTRNDGIAVARGRYIAVMDSDDIALPERLSRQFDYMEMHRECVVLGTAVRYVGPDLLPIWNTQPPLDHETIDRLTLAGAGAAILQGSAMFRAEAVRTVGGYRDEYSTHEEADLYLRLGEIGRLANLPEVLYLYRQRPKSLMRRERAFQPGYGRKMVREAHLRRGLPVSPTVDNAKLKPTPPDHEVEGWALWSHQAVNGGYLKTARCYAWRALRAEPLSVKAWKAVARAYVRQIMARQ